MTPIDTRPGALRGSAGGLGYPVPEREQDGTPE